MTDSLADDGNLVRVRAQVMMRDDSTGGWVPLGGGGLSHVAVRKRKLSAGECEEDCQHEYLILGKRMSDQLVVLSCTIKRDFEYNKVMPTFHHWKTGNKKFGLTFQTAADARAFDRGVNLAVEDLLEGVSENSPLHQIHLDVGDEEVFMQLELPMERDSCSSNGSSPPPPHKTATSSASPLKAAALTTSPHTSSPLGPPLRGGDSPSYQPLENAYPQFDTHHRLNFLTRSQTIGGGSASSSGRGRGRRAAEGLPLGDPPPPGDNIYEWLHSTAQQPPLPLSSTSRTRESDTLSDKYLGYMLDRGGGGGGGSLAYESGSGKFCDSLSDAYVKFDIKEQEPHYHYPNLDSLSNVLPLCKPGGKNGEAAAAPDRRRDSVASLKQRLEEEDESGLVHGGGRPPLSGSKKGAGARRGKKGKKGGQLRLLQERCAHCQELYTESENRRGVCRYSPDPLKQGIDCLSCLSCAKCLLYHCHYEDENFSEDDICTCTDTDGHLAKRWLGLSLLAVLVPCLCLYPALTACYTCGRACHACGGKHVPV